MLSNCVWFCTPYGFDDWEHDGEGRDDSKTEPQHSVARLRCSWRARSGARGVLSATNSLAGLQGYIHLRVHHLHRFHGRRCRYLREREGRGGYPN